MMQSKFDILFEPVKIGPVTAPNRFYQVPHSTGLGHMYPNASASFRAMKAEGGWGVVSTGACDIHLTSDHLHRPYDRLWDDRDMPAHRLMVDQVHRHGSLAAVELNHSSINAVPFYGRTPNLAASSQRAGTLDAPHQARAMDLEDIRNFRRWHREAALRAKTVGYDIVYVYAAHSAQMPRGFLMSEHNHRNDAYGGSLENRARLLRELLEDTRDAVGDRCAVALRLSVADSSVDNGAYRREIEDFIGSIAEVPDLWDVNIAPWQDDSKTSRFGEEGHQEPFIGFVKKLTSKPVVGVGRFTSPDAMVSQIKRGVIDLIGAARPSIADPFLPVKIREGRFEEIRECIGCNICAAMDMVAAPIQCTQNPTVGEEWRRGWHPEIIAPKTSASRILVIGSGPAGLEAATALGRRGYDVALAERRREVGGRVTLESRLPGLSAWGRVRDHRLQLLEKLSNVEIFRESDLSADDALALGYDHIVTATGAKWRRDGAGASDRVGRVLTRGQMSLPIFTPDDLMAGADLPGPIFIYDDDHFYMANVLADLLVAQGKRVIFATPLAEIASWSRNNLDQGHIVKRLIQNGVELRPYHKLQNVEGRKVITINAMTGQLVTDEVGSLLSVTARLPEDGLYHALLERQAEFADLGIKSVTRIGDSLAPGLIAAAVFSGHEYARNLEEPLPEDLAFHREPLVKLGA